MKTSLRLIVTAFVLATFNLSAATHYVSLESLSPSPPYTNWATAAHVIQDAVDVAGNGDTVLVTNGVYAVGARETSVLDTNQQPPQLVSLGPTRVVVTNSITLLSVNGPLVTVIEGSQLFDEHGRTTNGVRCVFLGTDAALSGFTLTNGFTAGGGGVWGASTNAVLTNCVIIGNSAHGSGGGAYRCTLKRCTLSDNYASGFGGGAYGGMLDSCTLTGNQTFAIMWSGGGGACLCTLNNCTLTDNSAEGGASFGGGVISCTLNNCTLTENSAINGNGGGAYESTLNNCTLTGNLANLGGATFGGTLNSCIVYFNFSTNGANYGESTLNYCCTTPMPTNGIGNITNNPLFVDYAGGDLRLQFDSPCINAGNNACLTTTTDLDGNPRIVSGTVDIGAYEYQGTGSGISYAWLQQYGLPTDGSADYVDQDQDGHNNWHEYLADTSPLDANDLLHITGFTRSGTYNTLWWTSKSTRLYQVERRESWDAASPWETIVTNAAPGWNNVGFDSTGPQYFYRIRAVRP